MTRPRVVIVSDETLSRREARHLAEPVDVEVVAVVDGDEEAREAIESGRADAMLEAKGGWLSLRLPMAETARNAALGAGLAASGATIAALGTPVAAAGGVLGLAVKSALAEKRRRGQNIGRRGRKASTRLVSEVARMREGGASYRQIAETFNARDEATPSGEGSWYAATVTRLEDERLRATRVFLRRVGNLLAELDERGVIAEGELVELGSRHEVHPNRLWRAFHEGYGAPYTSGLVPPLARKGAQFRVSAAGEKLLDIWRQSERIPDTLEEVVLDLLEREGMETDVDDYHELCSSRGIDPDAVPAELVIWEDNRLVGLTKAGWEVAQRWRRIVDPDPRERLDIDFWPNDDEDDTLGPNWDWSEDPLS